MTTHHLPCPPPRRGRLLSADEVRLMLPLGKDGKPLYSRDWVLKRFAPEKRVPLGRRVFWFEHDALDWFDNLLKGVAA